MRKFFKHQSNTAPQAGQISLIILLGIFGLIGTLFFLTSQVKINGSRKEYFIIKDTSKAQGTMDTLTVTYHPGVKASAIKIKKMKFDDNHQIDSESIFFQYNSAFLVWVSLIAITVGCSLALSPLVFKANQNICREFELNSKNIGGSIAITLITGFCMVYCSSNKHLVDAFDVMVKLGILQVHPKVLNIPVLLCILVALAAILGQLLVNQAVGKLENIEGISVTEQKKNVKQFELLRNQLKFFLMVDAVLIVLSVLTTDALRRSIDTEISVDKFEIFPNNFVYLYGLMYTFFLALLYLPIYFRLRLKGRDMLEGIPLNDLQGDKKWMADTLTINETPMQSLQVALSILAPVLTSLAPGLLKI